jgi:adenosylmethionine-8-amino-7-oxononanoate aminotransferase
MANARDTEELRQASLDHLWMVARDWVQMAEEGGPLIIVDGKGVRVTDSDGVSWIDVNGGFGSVNVGYGRTEIAQEAREQMRRLSYIPSGTITPPLVRLVEKLAQITPGNLERSWPTSGGSEANETAIKMARAYHKRTGEPGRYKIISRRGSYHGSSGGVLWLGGAQPADRLDYEPAPLGMLYAPHPDPYRCELRGQTPSECAILCAQAIEDLIVQHGPKTVAAVIAEPIAGGMGVAIPGDEYWPSLRRICDKYGVLLIADEIVCGFGRTGKMFALDHWGVVPDIMTLAKGISSSYLPMGAAIASKDVADAFAGEGNTFINTLTFGGHPVAAAAALKNIEIIESEGMVQNSAEVGGYFLGQLQALKEDHPIIGNVRGLGLMLSIALVSDRETKARFADEVRLVERLSDKFRQRRLILSPFSNWSGQYINFQPPLCITRSEVDEIVGAVDESLGETEIEISIGK